MVAGQKTQVADKASCDRSYWMVKNTQLYWTLQNTWNYPTGQKYVARLFQEAPHAKAPLEGQLAVLTNVTKKGSSYFVAQELVVAAGMHLVLMGKDLEKLKSIEESLRRENLRRAHEEGRNARVIKIYKIPLDCDNLRSVLEAAKEANTVAQDYYVGKIHVLIQNPSGVTQIYDTTEDGIEVNLGRNFVASHLLTQQLLSCLKEAATSTYKPRIVNVSSVGHCQGTDFDPDRFLVKPEEGGAPDETFREATEEDEEENGAKLFVDGIDAAVRMYYRSKMAIIADTVALAREEPSICVTSIYPGSVVTSNKQSQGIAGTIYQTGFYIFNLDPTQGARSSLRAALDPDLNTFGNLQGSYFHCDGNPWTVADPTVQNPLTDVPYSLNEYAFKVRACTRKLCDKLLEAETKAVLIENERGAL